MTKRLLEALLSGPVEAIAAGAETAAGAIGLTLVALLRGLQAVVMATIAGAAEVWPPNRAGVDRGRSIRGVQEWSGVTLTPSLPVRVCHDYWGGCDPSTFDVALRAVAGIFGYAPGDVFLFLLLAVFAPGFAVLFLDPMPSDGREVAWRAGVGLATVAVVGHAPGLFIEAVSRLPRDTVGLLLVVVVVVGAVSLIAVAVYATVERSRQLAANLRGGPT
jgi:hypothetical protein